jgi:hypothetical protein
VSTEGLEPRVILNNKVELLMPSDFGIMSEDMLMTKYPSGNRPTLVYSNDDGTVNLAVNHTMNRMTLDQLEEAKGVFVGQFEQMYPSAKWYQKEITQINGRDFVVLELITPAVDSQIYNLMFITSLEDRMLMFSFNCTKSQMGEWQSQGQQIMKSVKIL